MLDRIYIYTDPYEQNQDGDEQNEKGSLNLDGRTISDIGFFLKRAWI